MSVLPSVSTRLPYVMIVGLLAWAPSARAGILKAGQDILNPGNAEESVLHWITLPFDDDEPPEMPEKGDR